MFWLYSAKEEGERRVKSLSWKKMTMGREVVSVSVGTKRRNQRLAAVCGRFRSGFVVGFGF